MGIRGEREGRICVFYCFSFSFLSVQTSAFVGIRRECERAARIQKTKRYDFDGSLGDNTPGDSLHTATSFACGCSSKDTRRPLIRITRQGRSITTCGSSKDGARSKGCSRGCWVSVRLCTPYLPGMLLTVWPVSSHLRRLQLHLLPIRPGVRPQSARSIEVLHRLYLDTHTFECVDMCRSHR